MKETKDVRFRRIAEKRVNKIIAMIRLLGNCSHRGNYEFTEEQVDKIFTAIKNELDKANNRYQTSMKCTRLFSLSDEEEN